jgi:hypothetical protein
VGTVAVWSLTPFFDELDILEIRLATLDDVVDFHVIGESPVTHSGHPKELHLLKDLHLPRWDPWRDKIIHRVIEMPTGVHDWTREKRQRKCLWYGFKGDRNEDWILLSDLDEIPHPDAVEAAMLQPKGYDEHILLCNMHVAKLNWRWAAPAHESWQIARIFPAAYVGELYKDLEEARLHHMEPIGPPGWHLSWMNNPEYKLRSFVHQELVPHADLAGAQMGMPLFPDVVKQELEWTDDLPPYVLDHPEKFSHMMIERP